MVGAIGAKQSIKPDFKYFQLLQQADHEGQLCLLESVFRGVNIDRLPTVLAQGIDVTPTDAVIYAAEFDKAWEYADFPKVILALDPLKLDRSFREVPSTCKDDSLSRLQKIFPTELVSTDGKSLWLSKLSRDDPRVGTNYEMAYAYWIPGNPFEALRAVLIFADSVESFAIEFDKHLNQQPINIG